MSNETVQDPGINTALQNTPIAIIGMASIFPQSKNLQEYWKKNLRYLGILLVIWFVVSYGCGILFADALNNIRIGGFKLGFWFAQQGSIYVFVILIFVYVNWMNKLDKEYDVDEG